MKSIRCAFLAMVVLGIGAYAAQPSVSPAQNRLLARRAAEADCYRKLTEAVYGLRLTSETWVRDFVAESDEIHASVDEFIRGVKLGEPTYHDDGICEVPGEITVAEIITTLKRIHEKYYRGFTLHSRDFDRIETSIRSKKVHATGRGLPRPDVAPGYEDAVEPLPEDFDPSAVPLPAIWQKVPPQARLGAIRAAEIDAQRRLVERIKGLRLTSETLVRDFMTEYDEISTRSSGILVGAKPVGRYLHADELVVEATMEVNVAEVFAEIERLYTTYYRGGRVRLDDIVTVRRTIQRKVIRETGMGVPNPKYLAEARRAGVDMPEWMGRNLSATGKATDPEIESAIGKLKAARAAELEAKKHLAEKIYELNIDGSMTIREFVNTHSAVEPQVQSVLARAIIDPPTFAEALVEVTVSTAASAVWTIVHQHMLVLEGD